MAFPRLLIVDSDTSFCQVLSHTFRDHFTLRTCGDGVQAWELLHSFRPDLMVMELLLPKMDGIALIHRIRQEQLPVKILVLTGLQTPYIMQSLQQLQVDHCILKPCDLQSLSMHALDLAGGAADALPISDDPKPLVGRILLTMGFSPTASGYRYLQMAVPLYLTDPSQSMTKELYAHIGKQYGKTSQLVERAIRAAIETAWKKRDERVWRQYLGCGPDGHVGRPTNGDLIGALAQLLQEQSQRFGA